MNTFRASRLPWNRHACTVPALLAALGIAAVPASAAGAAPAAAPASATATDAGWPREFQSAQGKLVVYQPQVDAWESNLKLKARAAVAITRTGATKPTYGVLTVRAETQTDMERRTVLIGKFAVEEVRIPAADPQATAELTAMVQGLVPSSPIALSLDRLLAGLERTRAATREVAVSLDPPAIFTSQRPAILVIIDGKPALSAIAGTDLQFVVNTNWDLFFHAGNGRYYLLHGSMWLTANQIAGPWTATDRLPSDFSRLPAGENWSEVIRQVPAQAVQTEETPVVYVSDKPAELILTAGRPKATRIPNTRLLYVTNTQSDLFLDEAENAWYYLVAGRWFRSPSGRDHWTPAGDKLPAEFARIPSDHPKAHVRASVRGTREAEEAVLLASIPQTATVQRAGAKAEVGYAGEPRFTPIPGTSVAYAVNTSGDVFRVGDRYYLCFQGVWFVSASPTGPWGVADTVAPEIYTIPSSSPKHHVTYVTVYESTPSTVVVGYTSGYAGVYAYGGTVYFGTGYYYTPYVAWGVAACPVYYPSAYTYGAAAYYNPVTGTYARGQVAYGPYGGYGRGAAYNPSTGTYARGAAAWGPNGAAWGGGAYNPTTGQYGRAGAAYDPWSDSYAAGCRRGNQYAQWGEHVVGSGDDWVHSKSYSNARGTVAAAETSAGGKGVAAGNGQHGVYAGKDGDNNLYAGANGNVYKRDTSGNWYQNSDGSWSQMQKPQPNTGTRPSATSGFGGLETEARNRSWGSQRAGQLGSAPFTNRSGTFASGTSPFTNGGGSFANRSGAFANRGGSFAGRGGGGFPAGGGFRGRRR